MDEQELTLRERQLRRCRAEGDGDYTPISVPLTDLEQLVAEVRRLRGIEAAARALGLAYHPETPRPYVSITPDGYPGSTLWAGCPEADRDHAAAQGAIERLRGALGPR